MEVILGHKARRFVGPAAFRDVALVDEPSEQPEAVLFAPAPADTLARLARGLDSSLSATTFVAPDLDAPVRPATPPCARTSHCFGTMAATSSKGRVAAWQKQES